MLVLPCTTAAFKLLITHYQLCSLRAPAPTVEAEGATAAAGCRRCTVMTAELNLRGLGGSMPSHGAPSLGPTQPVVELLTPFYK